MVNRNTTGADERLERLLDDDATRRAVTPRWSGRPVWGWTPTTAKGVSWSWQYWIMWRKRWTSSLSLFIFLFFFVWRDDDDDDTSKVRVWWGNKLWGRINKGMTVRVGGAKRCKSNGDNVNGDASFFDDDDDDESLLLLLLWKSRVRSTTVKGVVVGRTPRRSPRSTKDSTTEDDHCVNNNNNNSTQHEGSVNILDGCFIRLLMKEKERESVC